MSKILKLKRIADLDLETAQGTDQLLAQRNGESVRLLASDFATSAQGAAADTAVQPGDLAAVATSGDYDDLSNLPTLGTAAAQDSTAFATSAQGLLADSAVQPENIDTLAELNAILTDATLIDTNDARLSDARTPTLHKSTHSTGGSDALTPADIGAATAAQGALADSAVQLDTLQEQTERAILFAFFMGG